MSMEGFDPRWSGPEDYVLGITRDIWEDRRIASLLEHYAPDLIVRSPASVIRGNDGIIAATLATLAEFPDRELFGEDVIWTGAQEGFLSSHRLLCRARHMGAGQYGLPTGRALEYRILADCYCAGNAVHDEWLVRDQSAIIDQMGWEIEAWTRAQIHREGGPERCVKPLGPQTDLAGPYRGRGNDEPWGARLEAILTGLMRAEFSQVAQHYDRAAALHYPRHRHGVGHEAADRFWLGLRATLPSAAFTVHHVMGQSGNHLPPRAAIRWSLEGRHEGAGRFGPPSGAQLYVMGITHVEFGGPGSGDRIRREWSLIDETAIWKQILLATGSV